MADHSLIEWTDATWNPITGCTLVDHGCDNCYAAQLAATRLKHHPSRAGLTRKNAAGVAKFTGEVRFNEQWLDQPLRWTRPRRFFVCAHGDLFHESVPDAWIDHIFAVMALAPQHTFQVLTKRPERARRYMAALLSEYDQMVGWSVRFRDAARKSGALLGDMTALRGTTWPLSNAWIGTSISDQASADARIPELLACPAAIRFVSAEPLLGPVNLRRLRIAPDHHTMIDALDGYAIADKPGSVQHTMLDWVICGGESGPGARPMHPDWARSLRDQCVAAGVPFFFKQWGEWHPGDGLGDDVDGCQFGCFDDAGQWVYPVDQDWATRDRLVMFRVGRKAAGRLLDGRTWDQMPAGWSHG